MKLDIPTTVSNNNSKLFKSTAYDIRAYVGEPGSFFEDGAVLTPDAMHIAGSLMGILEFKSASGDIYALKPKDIVVVGYDNGPTSEKLAEAFADGLNSVGVDVYMLGVSSSGQVYQNQEQLNTSGHCQITRSHVEVTSNGAKFGVRTQGIHTYLLEQMNKAVEAGVEVRECEKGITTDMLVEGRVVYFNKMIRLYKEYFRARDNSLVAINVFGGTGIEYIDLFKIIFGEDVVILGADIDVNSGDLLADPTRKEMLNRVPNIVEVLKAGKRIHSFDLDADRGSLTEGENAFKPLADGHYLGDNLAFILAEYKLKVAVPKLEKKLIELGIKTEAIDKILKIAKTVYVDARYTSSVKDYVDTVLMGITEFHRKGHSLWKESITTNMKNISKLAGFSSIVEFVKATDYRDYQIEASLHLFATDAEDGLPRDDAVENIFILEKIIDELKIVTLKGFFANMPKRFMTKEIRTTSISNDVKDKITYDIIDTLKARFKDVANLSIIEFDGQIRIDWATGFIMYGMSNTSPKLTFMAEGSTADERNEALSYLMSIHNEARKKYGDDLPMDLSENSFYVEDDSYEMKEPDTITIDDSRAISFLSKF